MAARQEISDLLIGPAAGDLAPGAILIVIPDGMLHRLPFALLHNGDQYLVDNHEVFLVPSLRTLHYLRARARTLQEDNHQPDLDILAVGCSGDGDSLAGTSLRLHPFTDNPIPSLPHADREAKLVAGLFSNALVLTGARASEASLKESPLGTAGILHIAAHSFADEEDIGRSFIVMNLPGDEPDNPTASLQDGLLQWHEVVALQLRASLVTLASCRSAGGVLAYGEGITGLTQAFLFAGGNSVLATLTDVPDRFAARLMIGFYRYLRRGMSAAGALRAVQKEAMTWEDARTNQALWASFVLVGDGTVTVQRSGNLILYLSIVGIFVLLGLLVTATRKMRRKRSRKI